MKKRFRIFCLCYLFFVFLPVCFCIFRLPSTDYIYGKDTEAYFGDIKVDISKFPGENRNSVYKAAFYDFSEGLEVFEEEVVAYYFDNFSKKLYVRGKTDFTAVYSDSEYEKHKSPDVFSFADMYIFKTAWFELPGGVPNIAYPAVFYLLLAGIVFIKEYLDA